MTNLLIIAKTEIYRNLWIEGTPKISNKKGLPHKYLGMIEEKNPIFGTSIVRRGRIG